MKNKKVNKNILKLVTGRATNVDTYEHICMCKLIVKLLSTFNPVNGYS